MKKILLWGVVAGIAMFVVNMALNFVYNWIYPSFAAIYADTTIFRSWEDPLMALFWLYPLALGLGLAWVWSHTKVLLKKDTTFYAGLKFGWAYFVVAIIPVFLINVSSFNLPVLMVASWSEMSLFNGVVAGWIFAKFNR